MKLYELHVSVRLDDGESEMRWMRFCADNGWKYIRVVNERGVNNVQNMMSKWCDRASDEEAVETVKTIASMCRAAGFHVVRSKVEAMLLHEDYKQVCLDGKSDVYWELHFKVDVRTLVAMQRLFAVCRKHNWPFVGLSLSSSGQSRLPIVTIRLHEGTRDQAISKKDAVINALKKAGFRITDKIQREISIFDTWPAEDEGWFPQTRSRL